MLCDQTPVKVPLSAAMYIVMSSLASGTSPHPLIHRLPQDNSKKKRDAKHNILRAPRNNIACIVAGSYSFRKIYAKFDQTTKLQLEFRTVMRPEPPSFATWQQNSTILAVLNVHATLERRATSLKPGSGKRKPGCEPVRNHSSSTIRDIKSEVPLAFDGMAPNIIACS